MKRLYLVVSTDKYELPIAVFDRAIEVSKYLGYKNNTSIFRAINKKSITHKGVKIERVIVET